MTTTAKELLNDPNFIKKRIQEQDEYLDTFHHVERTRPDVQDVFNSAYEIRWQFLNRLKAMGSKY